ncbi:MAG: hypothetical protein U5L00_12965 [Desulfovermiculus sp.]|nr:hypothetical protein [Desulfovermiculus sp.]
MDKQFLEFWGQIFLAAAKNQKIFDDVMSCFAPEGQKNKQQSQDMEQWLKTWMSGYQAWQSFLSTMYGVDPYAQQQSHASQQWGAQELSALVTQNWKEMISLMGAVPRQDYDDLRQENQELKKRLEIQEERIQQLQDILQQKGLFDFQQMTESLQDVLKNQSDQFQELMQTIQASWKNEGGSSPGQDTTG